MGTMASQITSLTIVYSTVYSGADQGNLKAPRLKLPASRLFIQPFIQAQIKENIKASRHWHLCGEFTEGGEFPAQRASNAENVSIWWRHHEFVVDMSDIQSWIYWQLRCGISNRTWIYPVCGSKIDINLGTI